MDNGFLSFDHFRIPRDHLLMRWIGFSPVVMLFVEELLAWSLKQLWITLSLVLHYETLNSSMVPGTGLQR